MNGDQPQESQSQDAQYVDPCPNTSLNFQAVDFGTLTVTESVTSSGETEYWLHVHGAPDEMDHGKGCSCDGCTPAHERLGRLPKRFRLQCTAIASTTGQRCRNDAGVGGVCSAHRGKS